jgi:triphosphoribosyl-dephospho-CoA synthase
MDDLATIRRQLLHAREGRQRLIERAGAAGRTVLFASANIPGRDKCPPGVGRLLWQAAEDIARALPSELVDRGQDRLGPFAIFTVGLPPDPVKRATMKIESSLPAGRLLDLDVYGLPGRQVDRVAIGAPTRACLVCDRPAVECIRLSRHPAEELSAAVARLLLRGLASALVDGARAELELTPKPGLVDRLDNGSHQDLSFDAMSRSIDLLSTYFDELIATTLPPGPPDAAVGACGDDTGDLIAAARRLDLGACVAAGVRAERRMVDAIGTNTHKGYIFLAGLTLLAAATAEDPRNLRADVAALARRILGRRAETSKTMTGPVSHGERARTDHGLGGISREALDGLPSVFDRGLPALWSSAPPSRWPGALANDRMAAHRLMAVLMQAVEDTTAVHRCGPSGLVRLRADGLQLQRLIDSRQDYVPWLLALNEEYRRLNLTMGGVADCMALCFALDSWLAP